MNRRTVRALLLVVPALGACEARSAGGPDAASPDAAPAYAPRYESHPAATSARRMAGVGVDVAFRLPAFAQGLEIAALEVPSCAGWAQTVFLAISRGRPQSPGAAQAGMGMLPACARAAPTAWTTVPLGSPVAVAAGETDVWIRITFSLAGEGGSIILPIASGQEPPLFETWAAGTDGESLLPVSGDSYGPLRAPLPWMFRLLALPAPPDAGFDGS